MTKHERFFWPERDNKEFSAGSGAKALTCLDCKLYQKVKSPKMAVSGKGIKKILIVAEAPGEEEDRRGTQLVGQVGEYTRDILDDMGLDLDRDFWKTNAISCRPTSKTGSNRPPSTKEIRACRPRVWQAIRDKQPKVIILMGNAAVESFLGHRWKKDIGQVGKWVGWTIPDREVNAWVCPTYHPSFVMRNERWNGNAAEVLFRKHIRAAVKLRKRPLPEWKDPRDMVKMLYTKQAVTKLLQKWLRKPPGWLAEDFETTGLKPQAPSHRIRCMAVCARRDRAYAFPMDCVDVSLLKKVNQHEQIKKIASKMNFEEAWARNILKHRIRPWGWDTMICSHVLDNRPGISSIKFQAFVRYGILDYGSHISPYLKTKKEKGANEKNNIDKAPMEELLLYCGMDTLLEYWCAMDQMLELGENNNEKAAV